MVELIRNWIAIKTSQPIAHALEVLKQQSTPYWANGPYAIRDNKNGRLLTKFDPTEVFSPQEILYDVWDIMVPDDKKEIQLGEIRELFKDCNECFHEVSRIKINHMNMEEIWDATVENLLTDETRYELLKYYFQEKLYKKKK